MKYDKYKKHLSRIQAQSYRIGEVRLRSPGLVVPQPYWENKHIFAKQISTNYKYMSTKYKEKSTKHSLQM